MRSMYMPSLDDKLIRLEIAHCGDERVRPACFHVIALDASEREMRGGLEINRLDVRKDFFCRVIADDEVEVQTLDQRRHDAPVNGRDQMHPIG